MVFQTLLAILGCATFALALAVTFNLGKLQGQKFAQKAPKVKGICDLNFAAWEAALDKKVQVFWVRTREGATLEFAGRSWEEAGFGMNEAGEPMNDVDKEGFVGFGIENPDPFNSAHVDLVNEWWGSYAIKLHRESADSDCLFADYSPRKAESQEKS